MYDVCKPQTPSAPEAELAGDAPWWSWADWASFSAANLDAKQDRITILYNI